MPRVFFLNITSTFSATDQLECLSKWNTCLVWRLVISYRATAQFQRSIQEDLDRKPSNLVTQSAIALTMGCKLLFKIFCTFKKQLLKQVGVG